MRKDSQQKEHSHHSFCSFSTGTSIWSCENDCVQCTKGLSSFLHCHLPFSLISQALRLASAQLLLLLQDKELILQHETTPAPDLALAFVCSQSPSEDGREKKGEKGDERAQIKGRNPCLLRRVHLGVVTGRSAGVRLVGSPSSERDATRRNLALTKFLPKPNAVNTAPTPVSQSQRETV